MSSPSSRRARRALDRLSSRDRRRQCAPICLAAAAASIFIAKPLRADTYYLQRAGTSDWNSASDGYFTWLDSSTSSSSTLPPAGSTVFVAQSGTLGVSGALVNLNYAYNSTGLAALTISSGNQVSQTSAASAMHVTGDTVIGGASNTSGTYMQSAGTASFNNLYVGSNGAGVYSLSGGSTSMAGTLYVGYGASGNFVQTGGTNTSTVIGLGYSNGCLGTYSLSNQGSLNTGQLIVGWYASGLYNQSSGVASVGTNWAFLGAEQGASGTANISGGMFSVNGYLMDGYFGNGTLNQSGGTVHTSYLGIGYFANGTSPASVGTYSLSNGANLVVDNDVSVGDSGTGFYNQSGGSASIGGFFLVGYRAGSSGSANLSGGYLSVASEEDVGYSGTGQFYQGGGSNVVGGGNNLVLGHFVGSSGTYTLAGGVLSGPFDTFIGYQGQGNFVQTGGSLSASVVILGYSNGASGNYSLGQQGVLTAGNLTVGWNGSGFFNQTGGSNTVNFLYISYSNGSSGTYLLSGGMVSSGLTSNDGQFTQSGGTASLGTLTGSGTMTLGGSTEITKVTSFQQSNVTINSGGHLAVTSGVPQVTNTATTLSITGSGVLDLANSSLITNTSPSTVQQYLTNGYNSGAWNGTGGISSSNAAADAALGTNGVGKALGFVSGTSNFGVNLGLASNQTMVKYTIYGDSNLDGIVNILDFGQFSANFGHTGAGWEEGDYNYDGVVNILDFGKLSANFGHSATATVAMGGASVNTTLTGAKASSSASTVKPAATPAGSGVSVVVNTTTGDVQLSFNNIQSRGYEIDSPSGEMNTFDQFDTPPGPAMLLSDGNIPANDNRGNKYWIVLSSDGDPTRLAEGLNTGYHFSTLPTINQTFDLGDIYVGPSGTNVPDLSVLYVDGTGDGFQQVVQYVGVPEPTTLGLMGLAAAGLMSRRRKGK